MAGKDNYASWTAIVLWMIFFFPIGIILLAQRLLAQVPFEEIKQSFFPPETDVFVMNNPPPPKTKVIPCPGCGARTTISNGKTIECEYCGTILK